MNSSSTSEDLSSLAPYAVHDHESAGREHSESKHPYRGPFQRDRDRLVHSSAYRRLAHKTQVFTGELGDYHRSRLTHTLEVASISRTIGRVLRLNEDLIEALSLIHDIGHPPFGHAGEEILDECTHKCGGFDHNSHALRIVTSLEQRYPEFPGLNLSREVLVGQKTRSEKSQGPTRRISLEAQVVDAADSIAYDSHDADDALELRLLDIEELLSVSLWREAAERVQSRYQALDSVELRRATIHELIESLVSDLIETTCRNLETYDIESAQDVLRCETVLATPSEESIQKKSELESFLFERVYRHPTVLAERKTAGNALRELFERFRQHPNFEAYLPPNHLQDEGLARSICDYLAGMTDRHALELYRSNQTS